MISSFDEICSVGLFASELSGVSKPGSIVTFDSDVTLDWDVTLDCDVTLDWEQLKVSQLW